MLYASGLCPRCRSWTWRFFFLCRWKKKSCQIVPKYQNSLVRLSKCNLLFSQIFVTTRKFPRSKAPRRWSSPTPQISTSAGTRCQMLSVGYHGNSNWGPTCPAHAADLAGACRHHGNTLCDRKRPAGLCDVIIQGDEKKTHLILSLQPRSCMKQKSCLFFCVFLLFTNEFTSQ